MDKTEKMIDPIMIKHGNTIMDAYNCQNPKSCFYTTGLTMVIFDSKVKGEKGEVRCKIHFDSPETMAEFIDTIDGFWSDWVEYEEREKQAMNYGMATKELCIAREHLQAGGHLHKGTNDAIEIAIKAIEAMRKQKEICSIGPAIHTLKILPEYYEAVMNGSKNFELRKDDRGYKVGDFLMLDEWDGEKFTGRSACRKIAYILKNCPDYGLADGYCILGFGDNDKGENE